MNNRVLFVDDEPNVLDGIRRQLRNRVAIETATGGAAGLAMIQEKGPFAVVVSDMRMPDMNGARFLARVNEIAPSTVRMVLSGQADMDSTLAAVNEGHVFRFLMKPCDAETLLGVINVGIEQYRLIHAEKHLLENTLNATVRVLVEVLGLINPGAQRRATQIERYAEAAGEAMQVLPGSWKYKLAAMLSQLGCITLPAETLSKVYGTQPLNDEEKKLYESHPEVAAKLLAKIPRLEDVAAMVAGQLKIPAKELAGAPDTWKPQQLGAAILWAAVRFDQLVNQGKTPTLAAQTIRQAAPHLPAVITEAMIKAPAAQGGRLETRSVSVANLTVGMVFEVDVLSVKGIRLVPKGTEITGTLLERLRTIATGVGVAEPIRVTVTLRE